MNSKTKQNYSKLAQKQPGKLYYHCPNFSSLPWQQLVLQPPPREKTTALDKPRKTIITQFYGTQSLSGGKQSALQSSPKFYPDCFFQTPTTLLCWPVNNFQQLKLSPRNKRPASPHRLACHRFNRILAFTTTTDNLPNSGLFSGNRWQQLGRRGRRRSFFFRFRRNSCTVKKCLMKTDFPNSLLIKIVKTI